MDIKEHHINMNNLVRFTLIILVVFIALLSTLAVTDVISSDELWDNMAMVLKLMGIFFGASVLILLLANTMNKK